MTARTQHRTEAIVLRQMDYGESDRIVTFYTVGYGKVRGIAKGARRSVKRFANALEPFSLSSLSFSRRGEDSLALIEGSDVTRHFAGIRADLEKTMTASCMIDLMDQFTQEEKPNAPLFRLLHDFLQGLEGTSPAEPLLRFFEIRLLGLSGYEPVLDRCLACKTPVNPGKVYRFNAADGGLLCDSCRRETPDAVPVTLGTIRTLTLGRELPVDRLSRLVLSAQAAEESRQLLGRFIRHLLGRELKSVHVLNEVRRLCI